MLQNCVENDITKLQKNAGITSKKLKNGANYLNINVVTVTKRKSVKRKEKRDMKKKNDALDMENKRLQEQKAEAEQELKRAKKEVQTEKLKGAATTAATNIADLFSEVERRNRWNAGTRICKTAYLNLKRKPDKGNSNKSNRYRR